VEKPSPKYLLQHNFTQESRPAKTIIGGFAAFVGSFPCRLKLVQDLGKPLEADFEGRSGGVSLRKNTQNDILVKLAIEGLRTRDTREKVGGGEWSRTTDAADMSRVL
jgi:hypothetical protein